MALKLILVDDEYLGIQVLETYAKQVPGLTVVGKFENPLEALGYIQNNTVDLIFLDIQMPQLSGVSFLKSLAKPPLTAFTTAYSEYAVEAFDLNVIDYLLKPISFERFLKTINKANDLLKNGSTPVPINQPDQALTIKADGIFHKIPYNQIIYIESDREYVRLFTVAKRFYFLETMKNLEETLPSDLFVRVHKSFIVAKSYVKAVDGNQLDLGIAKVQMSRDKRAVLIADLFGKTSIRKPQN